MRNIIAVFTEIFRGCVVTRFRRPDKQVNNMSIALVDQCSYVLPIQIIQPASDQAEAAVGKIVNGRREFKLSVEPGFDRVLVGRRNIEKVSGQ